MIPTNLISRPHCGLTRWGECCPHWYRSIALRGASALGQSPLCCSVISTGQSPTGMRLQAKVGQPHSGDSRELMNRYFTSALCSWYATGGSIPYCPGFLTVSSRSQIASETRVHRRSLFPSDRRAACRYLGSSQIRMSTHHASEANTPFRLALD